MAKFCSNCGNEVNENADVCLHCGYMIKKPQTVFVQNPYVEQKQNENGKSLATISVVFGSLGFYPLIIIGSIVGLITSLIGVSDESNMYKSRSKVGLGLSLGSLGFWLLLIIIIATA